MMETGSVPPNQRLKLTGASKYGRLPFVRVKSNGHHLSVRCATERSARSLSAIR